MATSFNIPAEIAREIDLFEENVKKFRAGLMAPDAFQRIRLQHGIYGQRQDGVQMIRIKIPLGRLNAEQIECIADLAEQLAHNNAHITTRQDIQIHYVKLENSPTVMRRLAAVGLTTREACGNTVRNVTASPSAGVDPQEVFDVTPYAHAVTYHLLHNPICQNLGRKFKIAFDGGGVMSALPMMHEIGLIAQSRGTNGKEQRGFKVYVGGGLGSSPRIAKLFCEFLQVEELIPLAESILRVFDRHGERKVRMKARLKFLIEKFGFEKFKQLVEEERHLLDVPPEWNAYLKRLHEWEEKPPRVNEADIPKENHEDASLFDYWKKTNVRPQKQSGYSMVEVRLTTGDMSPSQMRSLAGIIRRYAGGRLRTIVHQNLLIRWVRDQDLPALHQELSKIGMAKKDAQTIYDVTACPGTDTCRLGIASSMGLARALEERLYREDGILSSAARDIRIKVSGCPNSCGQHHLANIGFYGGAITTNGRSAPAFQLMLGGNYGREMAVAKPIGQIPSKNVPEAVVRLVRHFVEKKTGQESFNDFYGRIGQKESVKVLDGLLDVPSYEQRPDLYKDWEGEKEFALQKGVIGECAGQMVENVPPKVEDGDEPLRTAEALFAHEDFEAVAARSHEAIAKSALGLLYYRLVQTFTDAETTHEWENHFVRTGIFPQAQWQHFHRKVQELRQAKASQSTAENWLNLARSFLKACHEKEAEVAAASPRKGKTTGLQPDTLAL